MQSSALSDAITCSIRCNHLLYQIQSPALSDEITCSIRCNHLLYRMQSPALSDAIDCSIRCNHLLYQMQSPALSDAITCSIRCNHLLYQMQSPALSDAIISNQRSISVWFGWYWYQPTRISQLIFKKSYLMIRPTSWLNFKMNYVNLAIVWNMWNVFSLRHIFSF